MPLSSLNFIALLAEKVQLCNLEKILKIGTPKIITKVPVSSSLIWSTLFALSVCLYGVIPIFLPFLLTEPFNYHVCKKWQSTATEKAVAVRSTAIDSSIIYISDMLLI